MAQVILITGVALISSAILYVKYEKKRKLKEWKNVQLNFELKRNKDGKRLL